MDITASSHFCISGVTDLILKLNRFLIVEKQPSMVFRLPYALYSGDHKFVQNIAAFLLANLSMSRVNLAVL